MGRYDLFRHNGRFSEDISHDEIGALPSHTRQVQKSVKIVRHPAAVLIPQYLHTGADIPGLPLSQSTLMDSDLVYSNQYPSANHR